MHNKIVTLWIPAHPPATHTGPPQTGSGTASAARATSAHSPSARPRGAYVLLIGPLADGHPLPHLCQVRPYISAAHLDLADGSTTTERPDLACDAIRMLTPAACPAPLRLTNGPRPCSTTGRRA